MKSFIKYFIPKKARLFVWALVPKVHMVNTYILKDAGLIYSLHPISSNFLIKQIGWADEEQLKVAHSFRGPNAYKNKIPDRLNSPEWIGLAVVDGSNGRIAYIAWVIVKNIRYIEEFGLPLTSGQFLLKDGFCVPEYRHKGLHTRMEQERINYCIRNGAKEILIQINDANTKGKKSVTDNGYILLKQNYLIQWPVFNVFRELSSFFKNPFLKVIK